VTDALIRTARRRRFAAMQMGDELLAADWGMVLERLERLGGPPDGYALVTPAGAFVGIWRARDIADKVKDRSQATKGETVRGMVFVGAGGA
jgi:hypothetical protein